MLGRTHVVECDRGLDMYTKKTRRARQCIVLYFEVHGDFNAADRAANAPVSAPVTPPVRSQEGRPAPSTLEKLPERGLRRGVAHAKVEPERKPKVGCNNSCLRGAPRKNEVKQQQDWRLVFVDRQNTNRITDCLDELMGEKFGFDRDLLSMSITAAAYSPVISHGASAKGPDQTRIGLGEPGTTCC